MKFSHYRAVQKLIALGIIILFMQTAASCFFETGKPNIELQYRFSTPTTENVRYQHRNNDPTESDSFGGSWFQDSFEDLNNKTSSNVSVIENGTGSQLELINTSSSGFYLTSKISLPEGMNWSHISISKYEAPDTFVNISLLDSYLNSTIPGFTNRTESYIDLANLNDSTVILKADFHGDINVTPELYSWGIEWTADNAWRDSFTGPGKIEQHSNLSISGDVFSVVYNQTSYLKSATIQVPPSHSWDVFHFDRTLPDNTIINISIHDAESGEVIIFQNGSELVKKIDLTHINSFDHGSVYLQASFRSNLTEVPVLHNWGINWSVVTAPKLIKAMEDIELSEDTPENNILDLEEYFMGRYSQVLPPSYSLENLSDIDNITLELNSSMLSVADLSHNWTGSFTMYINCTNVYNRTTSSNVFAITVAPINDPPAWTSAPPNISMNENTIHVSNYSLSDYVFDAEGDELELFITGSDDNITFELDQEQHIVIAPPDNFAGTGILNLTVSEKSGAKLASSILISYFIFQVDDPPLVQLKLPLNRSIITGTNVTLVWEVTDVDSSISNIRFHLYLGLNNPPELYRSGQTGSSRTILDLAEGKTYYWYVIPYHVQYTGICISGIQEFTVNRSVNVPCARPVSPLDGSFHNNTDIILKWEMVGTSDNNVEFHILLGNSPMNLTLAGYTGVLEFRPVQLMNNNTYYWKVMTIGGPYTSDCIGGLRNFTIDKSFIHTYHLEASLDIYDISMDNKQNTSFNLSLGNEGNSPMGVQIELRGSLAQYVHLEKDLILGIGDNIILEAVIRPGGSIISQPYNLTLIINHPGGVEELVLHVNVTDTSVNDNWTMPGEPDSDFDWFWFVMDIIVIIVLILGLGVLFRTKKKKKSDGEEKIEVENVQRGGNVYVVGGLNDDRYEGTREISGMLRSDTDLFGRGNSKTTSGIRPPKWLSETDDKPPQFMEDPPKDSDKTHGKESEAAALAEQPRDVFKQERSDEEELPPRAPRWHARSKINGTNKEEKKVPNDLSEDETSTENVEKSSFIKQEESEQGADEVDGENGYDAISMDFFFEKKGESE